MPTSVSWPVIGGTTYSIPNSGEVNWASLTNFLVAISGAQSTTSQKVAMRKALTSPVTVVAASDCVITTDLSVPGTVAVNLPAGNAGQVIMVIDGKGDAGTNNITITPNGSETIKGAATLVLSENRVAVLLVYNASDTDWKVIGPVLTPASIVTPSNTVTLTNKTIDGDNNTILDLAITTLKTVIGQASKFLSFDGSGAPVATKDVPSGTVVGTSDTQTLTNKTIDGDNNTVQDLALTSLKTVLADADKVIRRDASGIVVSGNTIPNSSALVTTDATQTLTAKTIDGDNNTVQDLGITSLKTVIGNASNFLSFDGSGAPIATKAVPSGVVVGTTDTQTLTNKTLTSPVVTGLQVSDYLEFTEIATPSTPASGKLRVYGKTDDKMYQLDDTGLEALLGGGGGVGQFSVVTNQNEATNWAASGAGITVATTTTAGNLPLGAVIPTAIRITPVSGTDYVYYRWTQPASLKNTKIGVFWYQRPDSGYADGDLKLEIYKNSASNYSGSYTEFALQGDVSGTSAINNFTGRYVNSFDADDGDYYEMRVVRVAGTTPLNIALVIVGPGVTSQGAALGGWQSYTPTFTGLGTVTAIDMYWKVVGDSIALKGKFTVGTPTATEVRVSLPNSYTSAATPTTINAVGEMRRAAATAGNAYEVLIEPSVAYVTFGRFANSADCLSKVAGTDIGASETLVLHTVTFPMTQLAGKGVVNTFQEDNLKNWTAYTPTYTGLGTVSNSTAYWTRVGDTMKLMGYVTAGTTAASLFSISLPSGYTIDTTKMTVANTTSNPGQNVGSLGDNGTDAATFLVTATGTSTSFLYSGHRIGVGNTTLLTPQNGSTLFTTADVLSWRAEIPISQFANAQNALVGYAGATATNAGLVKLPSSQVFVNTGNGFGSTATRRRRFSNTPTGGVVGTDITFADSASNGSTFTVGKDGYVVIAYGDKGSAQHGFAISRNSAGNVNPGSLTAFTQRLAKVTIAAGFEGVVTWGGRCAAGDVFEAIADSANNDTTDEVFFSIAFFGDAG